MWVIVEIIVRSFYCVVYNLIKGKQEYIIMSNDCDIEGRSEDQYVPSVVRCKICDAGEIGTTWTREVMLGAKSMEAMAARFECEIDEVELHVYTHDLIIPPKRDSDNIMSDEFYMDKLLRVLRQLESFTSEMMIQEGFDKSMVDSLTKLTKEIRTTVVTIAEFQGRMDRATTIVNVQNVENKILKLTNVIVGEVCDECMAKIIPLIEEA